MSTNLDLTMILQIFVVLPITGLFFLYLIIKILRKNHSRLNISLSLLYILTGLGILLNLIYSLIRNDIIVVVLNFITNFSTCFGLIFLFSTNQIMLKSEIIFTKTKQALIVTFYGILLFLMIIFYPFGGGVTINESTDWKPVWNFPIFIYLTLVITICAVIPIIITSIR
ncbi:MAG: hypothetical protein EU548_05160, partial [Promethearchaeota archaeon]